ncbi:unnamed protein product [Orchesella dallaii]|uniref:Uncharacterized protein n=1 Tax=Orchesella dallaii TaxID=48710 RepID=A0ABP1R5X8_9HEXA
MQSFGGNASTPVTFVGLGGLGGGGGTSRLSSSGGTSEAGMAKDPSSSHWQTRKDNQAHPILDTPVAPELMVLFEGLQAQMKNHKMTMAYVNNATANPRKVDSVTEEIDRVRSEMSCLDTTIHRQDLQSSSLVKDMEEISKISELMRNISSGDGAYTFGGLSNPVLDFMKQLVTFYFERMTRYKVELEHAEAFTEASSNPSTIKDLEPSLSILKDGMIHLAAQVHHLHESVRNELSVHENLSEVFGTSHSHWIKDLKIGDGRKVNAGSGSPLKKWPAMQTTGGAPLGPSRAVENLHDRLHSTLDNSSTQSPLNARTTPLDLSWQGSQSQPRATRARTGETTFSPVGGAGDALGFGSQPRRHQHYFPSPASPTTSRQVQGQGQSSPASFSGHKRVHK